MSIRSRRTLLGQNLDEFDAIGNRAVRDGERCGGARLGPALCDDDEQFLFGVAQKSQHIPLNCQYLETALIERA